MGQLIFMFRNEIHHLSPTFGHPPLTSNMPPNECIMIVFSFPIELCHMSFDTIWLLSWFLSLNLISTIDYFISYEICHDFFELIEVYRGSFDFIWTLSRFFYSIWPMSWVIWFNLRFAISFKNLIEACLRSFNLISTLPQFLQVNWSPLSHLIWCIELINVYHKSFDLISTMPQSFLFDWTIS